MKEAFEIVGIRNTDCIETPRQNMEWRQIPFVSGMILMLIAAGCSACELFMTKDPSYLDLKHNNVPPNHEFIFGTDTMGRDIFSMIWYGGRISLFIAFTSTLIAVVAAVILGTLSGCASKRLDAVIMRAVDIFLSIPNLLVVILLQAILGKANVLSIAFVIAITGWPSMARVIRTEVRQIRNSEYVVASRCMGGGFFHVLWHHLAPNFVSSIMFMVIMSMRNAIVAESTLSFMGIGLPVEVISWGSMLSLADQPLLGRFWWIILIPGLFMVATLLCLTNLGNYMRRRVNRKHSNL